MEALVQLPEDDRSRQTATPVEQADGPDSKIARRRPSRRDNRRDFRVVCRLPKVAPASLGADSETVVRLLCPPGENGVQLTQRFHFDGVFGYETPAQRLYMGMVRPLVSAALRGYNTALMILGRARSSSFELAEGVPEQGAAKTRTGSLLSAAAAHFLASQARLQKTSDAEDSETGSGAASADDSSMSTELKFSCYTLQGAKLEDVFDSDAVLRAQITTDGHAQVVGLHQVPIKSMQDLTAALLLVHRYRNTGNTRKNESREECSLFYMLQLTRQTRTAETEPISGAFLVSVIESPTDSDFAASAARRASFLSGLKPNDSTSSFQLPGAVSNDLDDADLDADLDDDDDSDSDSDNDDDGGRNSSSNASPSKVPKGKLAPTVAFLSIIDQLGHSSSSVALYNSSVLTTILRGALGGNGRALLLLELGNDSNSNSNSTTANADQAASSMDQQLLQMLNVGATARAIKNKATVSRKFLAQRAMLMAYKRAMGIRDQINDSSSGSSSEDDDHGGDEFGSDENLLRSYRAKYSEDDGEHVDSNGSKSFVVDRGRLDAVSSPSLGEKLNETWKPPEFGESGKKRDIAHLLARPKSAGRTRPLTNISDDDTDDYDNENSNPDRAARLRGAARGKHASVTSDEDLDGSGDEDGPPPLEDRASGDDADDAVPFPDLDILAAETVEKRDPASLSVPNKRDRMHRQRSGLRRGIEEKEAALAAAAEAEAAANKAEQDAMNAMSRASEDRGMKRDSAPINTTDVRRQSLADKDGPSSDSAGRTGKLEAALKAERAKVAVLQEKLGKSKQDAEYWRTAAAESGTAVKRASIAAAAAIRASAEGGGGLAGDEMPEGSGEWAPIMSALIEPQSGVERIDPVVVAAVYPELATATVFSGAEISKWLWGNMSDLQTAEDINDVGSQLLLAKTIGHADEMLHAEGVFIGDDHTWYFSFDGVGMRARTGPKDGINSQLGGGGGAGGGGGGGGNLQEDDWGTQHTSAAPPEETLEDLFVASKGNVLLEAILQGATRKELKKIISSLGGNAARTADHKGRSAVHYSVYVSQPKICALLAKQGALIDAKDNRGNTPLMAAVHRADLQLMAALLKLGANVQTSDRTEQTALHWAVQHFTTDGLKLLLGHRDCTTFLVNKQDVKEHLSPLHLAVASGAAEHVMLLLDAGADPTQLDAYGRTALNYSCYFDKPESLVQILNFRPHYINARDKAGRTALHFTCGKYGYSQACLRLLLSSKDVDVNATDLKLRSPLHFCAIHNRVHLAKALLQRGASPDAKDMNCHTPKHYAMHVGDVEMVTLFDGSLEMVERAKMKKHRASQEMLAQHEQAATPRSAARPSVIARSLHTLEEEDVEDDNMAVASAAGKWLAQTTGSNRNSVASRSSSEGPAGPESDSNQYPADESDDDEMPSLDLAPSPSPALPTSRPAPQIQRAKSTSSSFCIIA